MVKDGARNGQKGDKREGITKPVTLAIYRIQTGRNVMSLTLILVCCILFWKKVQKTGQNKTDVNLETM